MNPDKLRKVLCAQFCGDLTVRELPAGLMVSAMFEGADGDRLGCLVEEIGDGWQLSDDGAFLGDLEGYGVDVRRGTRAEFLARALRPGAAQVDPDTLQIIARGDGAITPERILRFLTAMARAQDIAFWSKERIRSTFREDATNALRDVLGDKADLLGTAAVDGTLAEFPADLVIRPHGGSKSGTVTAVFLVQAMDALQEALLLALELRAHQRADVRVAALVEDGSLNMGAAKAIRAVNRIDAISFFRTDEREAALKIARTAIPDISVAA